MRLLLDQNLSPALADLLNAAGHDAVHVRSIGLSRASDDQIMTAAVTDRRVVVSTDTDFGELLARTNADEPSVGAIVVFDADRIRVRRLPLRPPD